MLSVYCLSNGQVTNVLVEEKDAVPAAALWVDLVNPTEEEEKKVEAHFSIDVPTRKEIRTIEVLSNFTEQMGTLFMTATVLSQSQTTLPVSDPITFILTQKVVITCRYSQPSAFATFAVSLERHPEILNTPERVFLSLLKIVIHRLADVLDKVGIALDAYSQEIFSEKEITALRLKKLMTDLGRSGELLTRINESHHSLMRLVAFAEQSCEFSQGDEGKRQLRTLTRDLSAIRTYNASLTQDINFLLNASLGLINIQQNQIIKIFSVAAVLFLPPTLVASVYGMNFQFMPELGWRHGYPLALSIMLVSALLPYFYFKKKGWL